MVLELLINPQKMVNRPARLFAIGAIYSLLAVILSLWIFRSYASLIMITLTTIAIIPFVHKIFVSEETKEIDEIEITSDQEPSTDERRFFGVRGIQV